MECKQGQSSAKHQWEWMVVKVYPILITANCYKHFLLELCVRVCACSRACVEVRGQHLVSLLRHCPPCLWESPTGPKPVELQSLPYLYWDFKHILPDLVVFPGLWLLNLDPPASEPSTQARSLETGRGKDTLFCLLPSRKRDRHSVQTVDVMGSL